ncbi:MAG: hypothetical protein ACFCU9_14255 [Cyanophyceae cyanobacterium]
MTDPDDLLRQARMAHQAKVGHPRAVTQAISQSLIQQGIPAQVDLQGDLLRVRLNATQVSKGDLGQAQVYLTMQQLQIPGPLRVKLFGLDGNRIQWQREFDLRAGSSTPWNRFSFDHPLVNLGAFPISIGVALLVNHIGLLQLFHLPMHIWIHEFGHAIPAWLCGRRAIPLPFGITFTSLDRELFVYVGILFLIGVLFVKAWQERLRGLMGALLALVGLQFWMTWMWDYWRFDFWVAFGGVAGEFILSALLMMAFYLQLPDRWRWDAWRFVILGIAASSFWKSYWMWHSIARGQSQIPWGSLFGGQGDTGGDMNRLNLDYGWSPDRIIDTYNQLGSLCLLGLLGAYIAFAVQLNPVVWFGLRQRWILWWYKVAG